MGKGSYKGGVVERERACLPPGNAEDPDSQKVILDTCGAGGISDRLLRLGLWDGRAVLRKAGRRNAQASLGSGLGKEDG